MSEKRSCPGVAAPEQQEMEGFGGSTLSVFEFNTYNGTISSLLSPGQENAIPLRHLKNITGLDGRVIRQKIQRERLDGVPILSDNCRGYYLAATAEERGRCVRSLRHRSAEIMKIAACIEQAKISSEDINV